VTDEFGPQKSFDEWLGENSDPRSKIEFVEQEAVTTAAPEGRTVSTEQEEETVEVDTLLISISLLEGFVSLFKESRDQERCRLLVASLKLQALILEINDDPPKLPDDYIREYFNKQTVFDIVNMLYRRCEKVFLSSSENDQILTVNRNYLEKLAQSIPGPNPSPSNKITSEIDSINLKLEQSWSDTSGPNSDKNHSLENVTLRDYLFGGIADINMARHVGLWIAVYIAPLPRGWQNSRYCLREIMHLYFMYERSKDKGANGEWHGEVYMAIERMQLWAKVGLRKGAPRVNWPHFEEYMSNEDFKDSLYQIELLDYPEDFMPSDRDSGRRT
jgi:hypothetical protein